MNVTLKPMELRDRGSVIDILNYYIEHTFAAYPESTQPYEFFDAFLKLCEGYPAVTARDEADEVVGFGMLRPYNPIPTFAGTAEITYFIRPEHTGRGIGKTFLTHLVDFVMLDRLAVHFICHCSLSFS